MQKIILTILSLFFIINSAFAMELGQKSPHDLTLKDQNGDTQSFNKLSGEKGLAVFFIRSVDWCPFCQTQLKALNKRADDFKKTGYHIAALSYDPVVSLKRFEERHDITYTLLSDEASEVIKAFHLLNEDVPEDTRAYGTPHPAIVIIGRDQMIQTIHQEDGYKKRPDLDNILDTLGAL